MAGVGGGTRGQERLAVALDWTGLDGLDWTRLYGIVLYCTHSTYYILHTAYCIMLY